MNNTTKIILLVLIIVILVAVGAFAFSQTNTSQKETDTQNTSTENQQGTSDETSSEAKAVFNEPTSENPPNQGNVAAQPVYLVSAYTRHEKDYIGVDYVMVFEGREAVEAMIEDGLCATESECEVSPDGYIRNNNSHFRAYEISTTTPLAIEVSGAIRDKAVEVGMDASALTFEDLKEILPVMPAYIPSEFPFKEPKSFVYIDILGEGVIKIREP